MRSDCVAVLPRMCGERAERDTADNLLVSVDTSWQTRTLLQDDRDQAGTVACLPVDKLNDTRYKLQAVQAAAPNTICQF